MTGDLKTQVRDYAEFFVSTVESINVGEIKERPVGEGLVRPIRPPASLSRRRGLLVTVAAAAAVLVLVGGAAWLLRIIGAEEPVATTDPLSSSTWSRIPHDEAVFAEAGMESVTAGGPGLVAVGGNESAAVVWTSVDGVTWSRIPHDEDVFAEAGMESVTAGGPGLVAVGWVGSDEESVAAVWTSVDGVTWSRAPHDGAVFGEEGAYWMVSVTAGGPGLVAVGGNVLPEIPTGPFTPDRRTLSHSYAVVWTSVDGITWRRAPRDEAVFGWDSQSLSSVTAGGPGLVAVGRDRSVGEGDAAVWTSVDGVIWSRVPHDEDVFGGERGQWMESVTAGGPGLVAVGAEGEGDGDQSPMGSRDAAVWTSVDGVTWSRVPHDEDVFGGEKGAFGGESLQVMNSVTAEGRGLVAVGWDRPVGDGDSSAAVWASIDGVTWSRVLHDETVFGGGDMWSVTAAGPGLVAVGSAGSDGAVWVLTPED